DIVGKEMYTFEDKSGRSLSLRPEGTAPAARAYIEHSVYNLEPVTHWFYMGPMFRYERMKTGRYRQFWQIGAEAFGAKEPAQDVELMDMVIQLLNALELKSVSLLINSLGDDLCRPKYLEALVEYLNAHRDSLCADCRERLSRNPLRVLDCKNEGCRAVVRSAPSIQEFLCAPCREHFDEVKRQLGLLGHRYEVDPRMVRGLDYYTRTAFEFVAEHPALGTASTVGGGGRYDKLIASLGGPDVPGIGFALGVDRLCLLLSDQAKGDRGPDLFVVTVDEKAKDEAIKLVSGLRRDGFRVEFDARGGSLKSQMKRADKSMARFALVLGETELATRSAQLKPLRGGEARQVSLDQLPAALRAS
ncbi:MAG TPA: histidine--tRNA ligase, partial [Myxococcaceae bacterium]|nr:histidine--tRNA ligase [Myxococcaceae bacterium]